LKIRFTRRDVADFQYWQKNNVKVYERVRLLIKAARADSFCSIGKHERLRHHKNSALYSRRIEREHRLVYSITDGELTIIACRFHYESLGQGLTPFPLVRGKVKPAVCRPRLAASVVYPLTFFKVPHAATETPSGGSAGDDIWGRGAVPFRARAAHADRLALCHTQRGALHGGSGVVPGRDPEITMPGGTGVS